MTKALPFTKAGLKRAIGAARDAGLRVKGIAPDGTLVVHDGENAPDMVPSAGADGQTVPPSTKWEDVQA